MASLAKCFRLISGKKLLVETQGVFTCPHSRVRSYADTPNPDTSSKQVAQGTENEEKMRVRRARASDVPRVLRFVRENARSGWPGLVVAPTASQAVVCDYVARALAQGHSMLAEQQESRRSWLQIRGLALGTSVCPWDAGLLEKWARCVRCPKSRRLMYFTAHCLRAPALHDKYKVHNILQIYLMIPPNTPRSVEITQILVKNTIQRGYDVGFPLIRFDVTNNSVAKSLEELNLKKEWELAYDFLPDELKRIDKDKCTPATSSPDDSIDAKKAETCKAKSSVGTNFITVYTAFTQSERQS